MKKICGIYCIENLINGKKYIGKTVNIENRLNYHRNSLFKNIHFNTHLQNAWNNYGDSNFKFYTIEECLEENLEKREVFYISYFNTKNTGYNMTDGGEGALGRICSNETRKQMSKNHSDISGKNNPLYGKQHSEETKKKISKKGKGKIPWNKGRTDIYTEETKNKMRKSKTKETKTKMSLNHSNVSGKNNPMYGKHHTEETKEKIRESKINKENKHVIK